VAAFAQNLLALLLERQTIDLDHVVEHAREDLHHLAVLIPVEFGEVGEGMLDEAGEIHRAEKTAAVGWKRLFAAVTCHQPIEDEVVLVRLRRIEHGLFAGMLDANDGTDEFLPINLRMALLPRPILLVLRFGDETDLFHEAIAGSRTNDQLVVGLAVIEPFATLPVRQQSVACRTALQHPAENAEIREQQLHILQ
jgi:hypothetical protein